jgi:hypothetical protein
MPSRRRGKARTVFKIIRPGEASETDMEAGRGTQVRLVDASLGSSAIDEG